MDDVKFDNAYDDDVDKDEVKEDNCDYEIDKEDSSDYEIDATIKEICISIGSYYFILCSNR